MASSSNHEKPWVDSLFDSEFIPNFTDCPDINQFFTQQGKPGSDLSDQIILTRPYPKPVRVNNLIISSATAIGSRPEQQDCMVIAPSLCNNDLSFFAIFDGTTGSHAAEYVRDNFLPVFYENPYFKELCNFTIDQKTQRQLVQARLTQAILQTYTALDAALLRYCELHQYDYTASTAVTCFLYRPTQQLYVAHLADSQAIVGIPHHRDREAYSRLSFDSVMRARSTSSPLDSYLLTRPHKPNDALEHERIRRAGGSLVYLRGNKPFIRAGDFQHRTVSIQLNYSRAFGGKDLKTFGLSCVPDVRVVDLNDWSKDDEHAVPLPVRSIFEQLFETQQRPTGMSSKAAEALASSKAKSGAGGVAAAAADPATIQLEDESKEVGDHVLPYTNAPVRSVLARDTILSSLTNQQYPSQKGEHVRILILGSDGVFDVIEIEDLILSAFQHYVRITTQNNGVGDLPPLDRYGRRDVRVIHEFPDLTLDTFAQTLSNSPARFLVWEALYQHIRKRTTDNVTCITVFF